MVGEEYEKFPDMEKVIEVTETVDFPSIYKNTYGEQYTEEQFKEFRDAVKKHIMQNGGLYTSIVGTGLGNAYVRPDNNELWANHAVTIVGWDDNYSKDNFLITPPGDGAWIVKNSWVSEWGDNGYMYVSYYDGSLSTDPDQCMIGIMLNNTIQYNKITNMTFPEYPNL